MQLEIAGVTHFYGSRPVLAGLSLSLAEGEIGVLVGPSGAGKSTVLNCIAGLERVSSGEIRIGDALVSSKETHVAAERRRVGMMFQESSLFPHLSVRDNIAFGMRANGTGAGERIRELAGLCGLEEHLGRFPHELSGGQQQRASLARSLAPRPRLLLLDEPFSGSDALLRGRLLETVRAAVRSEGATLLMVTHDQEDAFAIADRCGVIDAGSICQWDSAYNLYHKPNCMFVANFIGDGELVEGRLVSETEVDTEIGPIRSDARLTTPLLRPGSAVKLLMRPDDLVLAPASEGVAAEVVGKAFRGAEICYSLATDAGTGLKLGLPSRTDFPVGERIRVRPCVEHVVLFPTVE